MVRTLSGVLKASIRFETKCVDGADHIDREQSKGASIGSGYTRFQNWVRATPRPF